MKRPLTKVEHFNMRPKLGERDYSFPLSCVLIGSFSYKFQGNRCFDWTFTSVQNAGFVVPLENLERMSFSEALSKTERGIFNTCHA